MTKAKKIIVAFFGIFILLGLLNFGINIWTKSKLPQLINNENNTDYTITYENIELSLWSSRITAHNVSVSPKKNIKNSDQKIGLFGNI